MAMGTEKNEPEPIGETPGFRRISRDPPTRGFDLISADSEPGDGGEGEPLPLPSTVSGPLLPATLPSP